MSQTNASQIKTTKFSKKSMKKPESFLKNNNKKDKPYVKISDIKGQLGMPIRLLNEPNSSILFALIEP